MNPKIFPVTLVVLDGAARVANRGAFRHHPLPRGGDIHWKPVCL